MSEFWQPVYTRSQQSQGVWSLQPAFTTGKLIKTGHVENQAALELAVEARNTQQGVVDLAEGARDASSRFIRDINIRMPGVIDAEIEDDHPLADQLDTVYAVDPTSEDGNNSRAIKLIALWKLVNEDHAAQEPALTPLLIGTLTVTAFETKVKAHPALQQTLEDERAVLSNQRNLLRTANRTLDKANKQWYKAWNGAFAAGTPENDALVQIDTGTPTQLPEVLQIAALTTQEDGRVLVSFVPDSGDDASELLLLYRVVGSEAEFGHAANVTMLGQRIGPFTLGTTVEVKTVTRNSAGSSESEVMSITL